MQENQEERFVKNVLRGEGFDVARIAETINEKRADFRATYLDEVYLVEVKRLDEAPFVVGHGEIAHQSIALGYRNTLVGVVRDASRQLAATPTRQGEPLRVAWFLASGLEADAYVDQLRATLYGGVDLVWDFEDGKAKSKPC